MATLRKTCAHNQRNSNTPARQQPPFNFLEISEEFVMSQLRSLKSGKAVGLGRILARLLKNSADIVVKPVTFIINASLRTAQVPSDRKSARVIPLFKKGKADELDNYRPISFLPVLFKVLRTGCTYLAVQISSGKQDLEPLTERVSEVTLDGIRCS